MNVDYAEDGVDALHQLKKDGFKIFTLETVVPSTSVFAFQPLQQDTVMIGNEEMSVDESIITMPDHPDLRKASPNRIGSAGQQMLYH